MAVSWRRGLKRITHIQNDYIRYGLSEFFGTMVLVFMIDAMVASAVFSRMLPDGTKGPQPSLLHLAFGCAMSVMVGVLVAGSSGAHINPAITAGMAILGRINWKKTLVYWFAQYSGALLGAFFIYVIYCDSFDLYDGGVRAVSGDNATAGIFATYPSGSHIRWSVAFLDQLLATAILMFGVLAITDDKNWGIPKPAIPLYVGLLIGAIVMSMGYNCGAAMNPARDLMPRLFTYLAGWGVETFSYWNYTWFWIPIVGTHAGAFIGAVIYQVLVGAHWPDEPVEVVVPQDDVDMGLLEAPIGSPSANKLGYTNNGRVHYNGEA